MKIDYNKIIFNTININFILKCLFIILLINITVTLTIKSIENKLLYYFNDKYSYELFSNYYRGTVTNPQSFLDNANIYKNLKKFDKEERELKYARNILYNSAKNIHNTKLLEYIDSRIIEITKSKVNADD
jgi:hypothetical protein